MNTAVDDRKKYIIARIKFVLLAVLALCLLFAFSLLFSHSAFSILVERARGIFTGKISGTKTELTVWGRKLNLSSDEYNKYLSGGEIPWDALALTSESDFLAASENFQDLCKNDRIEFSGDLYNSLKNNISDKEALCFFMEMVSLKPVNISNAFGLYRSYISGIIYEISKENNFVLVVSSPSENNVQKVYKLTCDKSKTVILSGLNLTFKAAGVSLLEYADAGDTVYTDCIKESCLDSSFACLLVKNTRGLSELP